MTDETIETYSVTDFKMEDENTNVRGGKATNKESNGQGQHSHYEEEGDEDEESHGHGQKTMGCPHQ